MVSQKIQYCSFCRKTNTQVRVLITGGADVTVAICNNCVAQSQEVIRQKTETASDDNWDHLTPKIIYNFLDQYTIGQSLAKKTLSVAVHNHIKRIKSNRINQDVEIEKSNILLLGPTGSGKTLLTQSLAKVLEIPYAMGDATTLTEAGYVGEDVENLIARLYQASNSDVKLTERGIVYIDEIDKIARKSEGVSTTRDVSGEGVQQALLKLLEGSKVSIPAHGTRKTMQVEVLDINTKNILFVTSGAFVGLTEIIRKRLNKNGTIGFNRQPSSKNQYHEDYKLLQQTDEEDLKKFGMIPELCGRLPVVVALQKLSEEQLVQVLTEPKNALIKQYVRLFEENGVELSFHKNALYSIAAHANKIDLGARALRRLLEKILLDLMFEVCELTNKKIEITEKMVEDGINNFKRIMDEEQTQNLKQAVG